MDHNLVPHFILTQFARGNRRGEIQAATIFIDVSGFTPLTVALMQHARDGAEALADALRTVHAPFVQVIYAHGGFIPLFAGDGITAIFPVEENPQATAQAAAATAETIRRLVSDGLTVQTRFGDFTMGVKMGLAYGMVQWGIPGAGARYTYYLRGPAVDACAHAQQRAQRGQILADATIVPLLAASAELMPLPDLPYMALERCDTDGVPVVPPPPLPTHAQLAPFVAPAILDLQAQAELREACVVFLTFVEPAQQVALDDFVATVLQTVHQYGGEVNQVDFGDQGGLIILLFGAPLAREQVVERTAACLLALRHAAQSMTWRAGVTFGTLWAGFRGGAERTDYGATGLVMNMASRFAQKAPWGETWVDAAVYQRLAATYQLDSLGEMLFKGRTEPQPVYALRGAREQTEPPAMARSAANATPLISRDQELAQLQQWLHTHLAAPQISVLTITGEAGIGKSRLVQAARQWLTQQQSVHWFTCPADAILRQSLHPFRVALHRYFGQQHGRSAADNQAAFTRKLQALLDYLSAQDSATGDLCAELERTHSFLGALLDLHWPGSLYATLEPELRFANTLSAITTLIHAGAQLQPVVLHLEDAQWLDADSRAQLDHLLRGQPPGAIALLVTIRNSDEAATAPLEFDGAVPQGTLRLAYLDQAGVQQQANQVLGAAVTDAAAAFLLTKTNGNPYFVEQLAQELHRRNLWQPDDEGRLTIHDPETAILPTTLTEVLVARLDRLPVSRKRVVQTAAVLGRDFALPVLQAMLPEVTDWDVQMQAGVAEHLWSATEATRYTFHHALLRDAAYDMQLRAQLRALHRQAGAVMERLYQEKLLPHAATLAYHYDRAEVTDLAVHWYGQAGEQALAQYANDAASRHFRRGLELAPSGDATTRYLLLLGSEAAHNWLGQRVPQQAALEALEAAAETLGDNAKRSEVWLRKTALQLATGLYQEAAGSAEQAVLYAQATGNGLAEARAYHRWGRSFWQAGNYQSAIPLLEKALHFTRTDRGRREAAQCLYDLAIIRRYESAFDDALHYLQEALEIYTTIGDHRGELSCYSLQAVLLNLTGQNSRAKAQFEQALQHCRRVGWRYAEARLLAQMGNNALTLGALAEAEVQHQAALALYLASGDQEGIATSQDSLGLVYTFRRAFAAAVEVFNSALLIHRTMHNQRGEGYVLTHLGYALLADPSTLGEALTIFEEALEIRRRRGDHALLVDTAAGYACALLLAKRSQEAIEYCLICIQWLNEQGTNGVEFPILVYLSCYQVLIVVEEVEPQYQALAAECLNTGYARLMQLAAYIDDATARQQFFQEIPFHDELLSHWHNDPHQTNRAHWFRRQWSDRINGLHPS